MCSSIINSFFFQLKSWAYLVHCFSQRMKIHILRCQRFSLSSEENRGGCPTRTSFARTAKRTFVTWQHTFQARFTCSLREIAGVKRYSLHSMFQHTTTTQTCSVLGFKHVRMKMFFASGFFGLHFKRWGKSSLVSYSHRFLKILIKAPGVFGLFLYTLEN